MKRKAYPTDVSDEEWAFVAQYLTLMGEDAPQREHIAYVDQGYTGDQAAQDAAAHHMQLKVVKLPEAKKGFVLLPKRWVVERSFAWSGRFRRLARDYERLAQTIAGLHVIAFAILMLKRFVALIT